MQQSLIMGILLPYDILHEHITHKNNEEQFCRLILKAIHSFVDSCDAKQNWLVAYHDVFNRNLFGTREEVLYYLLSEYPCVLNHMWLYLTDSDLDNHRTNQFNVNVVELVVSFFHKSQCKFEVVVKSDFAIPQFYFDEAEYYDDIAYTEEFFDFWPKERIEWEHCMQTPEQRRQHCQLCSFCAWKYIQRMINEISQFDEESNKILPKHIELLRYNTMQRPNNATATCELMTEN